MNTISRSLVSERKIWAGRILTGLVTVILVISAIAKLAGVPKVVDGLTHAGVPQGAILPIAVLELSCLALYLFPKSAALGTFLLTGYFGGATVTHIIAGESIVPPLLVGLWVWVGAFFRIPELQGLLPLRKGPATPTFGAGKISSHSPLSVESALNTGFTRKEQ